MDIHIARQTNRFTTSWGTNNEVGTGGEGEGTFESRELSNKAPAFVSLLSRLFGEGDGTEGEANGE